MKCEFAKTNPLIIKQAMEFYLKIKMAYLLLLAYGMMKNHSQKMNY